MSIIHGNILQRSKFSINHIRFIHAVFNEFNGYTSINLSTAHRSSV